MLDGDGRRRACSGWARRAITDIVSRVSGIACNPAGVRSGSAETTRSRSPPRSACIRGPLKPLTTLKLNPGYSPAIWEMIRGRARVSQDGPAPMRSSPTAPRATAADLVARVAQLHAELPRVAQQGLALGGERHAPGLALEQVTLERGLEAAHGLRQARLRDPERPRGGAEAAVTGHRVEVAELGQVHDAFLSVMGNVLRVILT